MNNAKYDSLRDSIEMYTNSKIDAGFDFEIAFKTTFQDYTFRDKINNVSNVLNTPVSHLEGILKADIKTRISFK